MYLAAVLRVKAPPGMRNKLLTVLSTESPPPKAPAWLPSKDSPPLVPSNSGGRGWVSGGGGGVGVFIVIEGILKWYWAFMPSASWLGYGGWVVRQ